MSWAVSPEMRGFARRRGRLTRPAVLAQNHEIDPEAGDAHRGPEQPREIEEL